MRQGGQNIRGFVLLWAAFALLCVAIWVLNEEIGRLRAKLEPPRSSSVHRHDPFSDR
jgi:hypothetical protein